MILKGNLFSNGLRSSEHVCETKRCIQTRHFNHHFLLETVYEELDAATAARRGLGTVPSRNPFLKHTKTYFSQHNTTGHHR